MRADTLCTLVFTLWAATTAGTAYKNQNENNQESFVDATNKFSVALIKEVFKRPGNFIVSPLSVSTLLGMLQQGARDNTSAQLESVLHMNSETARTGFQGLISSLKNRKSRTEFKFGNSMFVNTNFDLVSEYREAMVRNFHATVEPVEFRKPSKAASKINAWVSNTTNGKIGDIIKADAISSRTEMVLANAMYFKGAWVNPFYKGHTQRKPFYKTPRDATPSTVDMMTMNISLRADEIIESLNAKWIDLPYNGRRQEYAMLVVLPNDNLDDMLNRLTAEHISAMTSSQSIKEVTLQMPKFKFETDLKLVPTLQALGLEDVFNHKSHLEGISTNKSPLIVSDVLHKAQIEVNEEGTEASAASSFLGNTLSVPPEYTKMKFVANKPFLAIIVDKISSAPLFVAKVANP